MSEPGKTETRVDEWMRDAAHEIRSGYDVCEGFEPFITEIIAKHYLASHAPSASAETICSNCGRDVNDKMSAEQRAEIERLRASVRKMRERIETIDWKMIKAAEDDWKKQGRVGQYHGHIAEFVRAALAAPDAPSEDT